MRRISLLIRLRFLFVTKKQAAIRDVRSVSIAGRVVLMHMHMGGLFWSWRRQSSWVLDGGWRRLGTGDSEEDASGRKRPHGVTTSIKDVTEST